MGFPRAAWGYMWGSRRMRDQHKLGNGDSLIQDHRKPRYQSKPMETLQVAEKGGIPHTNLLDNLPKRYWVELRVIPIFIQDEKEYLYSIFFK